MARTPATIRRLPEKSVEDRAVIDAILDEGFVCHVAYLIDGRPVVIPTLYVRDGDSCLLHGSTASGIAAAARRGSPLSVAVTLVDGLVVARSGFESSVNYRSVVIHGLGTVLSGDAHTRALDLMVEGLIPGRLADIRPPTDIELRKTAVVSRAARYGLGQGVRRATRGRHRRPRHRGVGGCGPDDHDIWRSGAFA